MSREFLIHTFRAMADTMREEQWLNAADPVPMLEFLRGKVGERKLRLFAVACCRNIWHRLGNERSRSAVEVAERFAGGVASDEELFAAWRGMDFSPDTADAAACLTAVVRYDRPSVLFRYGIVNMHHLDEAEQARLDSICFSGWQFPSDAAIAIARAAAVVNGSGEAARQAALLRCIFGNPFRLPARPLALILRGNVVVCSVAQAIYDERRFEDLPILADALEEAGVTDPDILSHLRRPGIAHAKGCFVLDWILPRG